MTNSTKTRNTDSSKNNKTIKNIAAPDQPGTKKGRNRSKAADQAILEATLSALADKGYNDLSANDILSRAGVSSATLYRRYGSLDEVVTAALQSLGPDPITIDEGCLEADLSAFIHYLGKVLSRDNRAGDVPGTRVDKKLRDAVISTFVAPRKALLLQLLDRALARGELHSFPQIDDCWSLVSGPIHHRIFIRNQLLTIEFEENLATIIYAGLKALR